MRLICSRDKWSLVASLNDRFISITSSQIRNYCVFASTSDFKQRVGSYCNQWQQFRWTSWIFYFRFVNNAHTISKWLITPNNSTCIVTNVTLSTYLCTNSNLFIRKFTSSPRKRWNHHKKYYLFILSIIIIAICSILNYSRKGFCFFIGETLVIWATNQINRIMIERMHR